MVAKYTAVVVPLASRSRHQRRISRAREIYVRVASFERKSASLQPLLERQVERQSQLRPLRRVHVQIDETRQQVLTGFERQQRAGRPVSLHQGSALRVRAKDRLNHPLGIDRDQRVRQELELAALGRMQRRSQKCAVDSGCRDHAGMGTCCKKSTNTRAATSASSALMVSKG